MIYGLFCVISVTSYPLSYQPNPCRKTNPQIFIQGDLKIGEAVGLLNEIESTHFVSIFGALDNGKRTRTSELHIGRMTKPGAGKRWGD